MYTDPSLIREHVVKLDLKPHEQDIAEALAAGEGVNVRDFLREAILSEAGRELLADMGPLS